MKKKKLLVLTGGGDCPGLNAVIRGIVKSALNHGGWEVDGSIAAFNGIGGDGSQAISKSLYEEGLNILGVPKTIDNDLSSTDLTFGFSTAVQIATDAFDNLVTTAESHNRVMILEVMGRDAGWIALHTALAGGAEICLIPEIKFNVDEEPEVRVAVLGHVQRGGTPVAFDRILATAFGVKAFEMANKGKFGKMVAYQNNKVTETTLAKAIKEYNYVAKNHYLIKTARAMGVSFGN